MRNVLLAVALLFCVTGASAPTREAAATQPAAATLRGKAVIEGDTSGEKSAMTRTVIFLASDPTLDALPPSPPRGEVQQIDKSFKPDFLVVSRGTDVEFPNWDKIAHNVFSRSAAAPAFDLSRYPYGQSKSRVFDKVGIVRVFCNIHPRMRAIIFVTPNRYFVRPDENGGFTLKDIPAGKYELVAWNERCEELHQSVELTPGQAAQVSLTLKASSEHALANQGPDRPEPYGVARGLPVKREQLRLPVVREVHPATTAPADPPRDASERDRP